MVHLTDILVYQRPEQPGEYFISFLGFNDKGKLRTKYYHTTDIKDVVKFNKMSHELVNYKNWKIIPYLEGIGYCVSNTKPVFIAPRDNE